MPFLDLDTQQLLVASKDGNLEQVKELLQEGSADANAQDFLGDTPLYWASRFGHLQVVRHLVEHGGAHVDSEEATPLCWASTYGHLNVVQYLVQHTAANMHRQSDGWTPLCWASYNGHLKVVEYLFQNGADLNTCDHDNKSPFYLASSWGHLQVAQLLLEKGNSQVDKRDKNGRTPLLETVQWHRIESVQFLLNHGADIHAENNEKEGPFSWACETGYLDAIFLMVRLRPQTWPMLKQSFRDDTSK